jgi:hypothetical protein
VCVTGCLPPDVLPDLADPLRRADGLLDRVLLAFPEAVPPQWTDATVTEATIVGYRQVLAGLWQLEAGSRPEGGQGARPDVMPLTSDGRAGFVACAKALYAQLVDPALPVRLRLPYAKLEGHAARLALLLQLCRLVPGEAEPDVVEAHSVTATTALIAYFQAHLTQVYAQLWSARADQRAEKVLQWIRAHGGVCTVRDVQRHRVAGITRASQAEKLVRDLVDLGQGELRERQLPCGRTQLVFVMRGGPA